MSRRRSIWGDIDWLTVLIYLVLVAMGWFAIYAAEYNGDSTTIWDMHTSHGKQFIWIIASSILAFLILLTDSKFFTTFAYLFYGLAILLLVLTIFIAPEIKGARSWIQIGGFSLQSSEFGKFAANLALAKYLSTLNININKLSTKLVSAAIIFFPALLIVIQGDAGSALVFTSFILVLYREGLPSGYLITGAVAVILALLALLFNEIYIVIGLVVVTGILVFLLRKERRSMVIVMALAVLSVGYIYTVDTAFHKLSPHQQTRINVLLGLEKNLQREAYNLNQSLIAIGSGGLTGKGFLQGTQTKGDFVPEQTTDFIFCTIGEEHGFLGSFVVLSIFMLLFWRIVYIAERQRSTFSRIYGYGVVSILFFHFVVNIGMTINLAPVMGIPLPFFSYGGSSILAFTILLFILLRLDGDRMAVLR